MIFLSKSLPPKKAIENPFIIERRIHNRLFTKLTALARRLSPLKKVLGLAFDLPKNCYVIFKGTFDTSAYISIIHYSVLSVKPLPFVYLPASSISYRILII